MRSSGSLEDQPGKLGNNPNIPPPHLSVQGVGLPLSLRPSRRRDVLPVHRHVRDWTTTRPETPSEPALPDHAGRASDLNRGPGPSDQGSKGPPRSYDPVLDLFP